MSENKRIDLINIKNKIIRYNGQKFTLKPYISANDMLIANQLCVDEYLKNVDTENGVFKDFPLVRIKFDIVVLNRCTDINLEGWEYDSVISSGLMQLVRDNIFNYNEVLNTIIENIRLINVSNCLNLIARALPSEEKMQQNIDQLSKTMTTFTKDNPDLTKKIVESTLVANSIEKSKSETQQKLQEQKDETKKKIEALQKQLDKKSKANKKAKNNDETH